MAHEGMVHALEEIHRLLKPAGRLIDIHPVRDAPVIEVRRNGKILYAESAPAHDDEDYRQADAAVAEAVRRRLFVVEQRRVFDFPTYAASVRELKEYLEDTNAYEDRDRGQARAEQEAALAGRATQALRAAGKGAEVVHHERARIARLRPVRR